jgi:hypothetical protein
VDEFYLGTDAPNWLATVPAPLFVSRRRLARRKSQPVAVTNWALDSGGFTEIHKYGGWQLSADEYADEVDRYAAEVGGMDWCAPQDWMCESSALAATGLTVAEHQKRTTRNFLELRQLLGALVIPVVQGWSTDDYRRHRDAYEAAGVDLEEEYRVGVGSICRRNADADIGEVLVALYPLRVHAFGVKGSALVRYQDYTASADSMAWSATARMSRVKLSACTHRGSTCAHCPRYAQQWRDRLLRQVDQPRLFDAG